MNYTEIYDLIDNTHFKLQSIVELYKAEIKNYQSSSDYQSKIKNNLLQTFSILLILKIIYHSFDFINISSSFRSYVSSLSHSCSSSSGSCDSSSSSSDGGC